jgi:hypothetical protein
MALQPIPTPGGPVPGTPREPLPGGILPTDAPQPVEPDETPDVGPTGPRTPYPVDDPGVGDPTGPGSEPDYLPGGGSNPMPRF